MLANPYVILAVVLFYVASVGGAGWKGYALGIEHQVAAEAEARQDYEKGRDAALQAAAQELAKLDIKQVTIRQKAETITREVPVYTDCKHDDRTMRLLNDALAPPGAESPGDGSVPNTGTSH